VMVVNTIYLFADMMEAIAVTQVILILLVMVYVMENIIPNIVDMMEVIVMY